jgi:hypothetical protein
VLSLDNVDLGFLESWASSSAPPLLRNESPELNSGDIESDGGEMLEVFRDYLGRWRPGKQDYMAAECVHLILCPAETEQLHSTAVNEDPGQKNPGLSAVMRDKIIVIIAEICKDGAALREISPFPSADLLGGLMWGFLTTQHAQVDNWIHISSFEADKASVELVLACIAAGAILRPETAVRKFGFALQEVLTFQLRRAVSSITFLYV